MTSPKLASFPFRVIEDTAFVKLQKDFEIQHMYVRVEVEKTSLHNTTC
jgi:hypothetical protein